jgi:hypothetical protein
VEALVNDRMLWAEQQFFGQDRVAWVRHPSAHELSETPPQATGHHPSKGDIGRFTHSGWCRHRTDALGLKQRMLQCQWLRHVVSAAAEKGLPGMIVTPGEGSGLADRIPTNGDYWAADHAAIWGTASYSLDLLNLLRSLAMGLTAILTTIWINPTKSA